MKPNKDLDAAILRAHAARDDAHLARLYARAADLAADDTDTASFFLTQAYVYALASGAPEARELNARLVSLNRDQDMSTEL